MTQWFRSWHGAPTDNKWLVIAAKAKVRPGVVSAVAWALFDHASQADERGDVSDFDTETYAVFSGFGENEVQAVIAAMVAKGVIDGNGRLTAWDKRQPKREDDSTERVKQHRARRNAQKQDSEQCNAVKRSVTHGNNTEQSRAEQNRAEAEADHGVAPTAPPTPEPVTPARPAVDAGAVYEVWRQNMPGTLSAILADDLGDLINTYGAETVRDAIQESVRCNGRTIRYVSRVLENWATGGRHDKPDKAPTANGVVTGFSMSELMGD